MKYMDEKLLKDISELGNIDKEPSDDRFIEKKEQIIPKFIAPPEPIKEQKKEIAVQPPIIPQVQLSPEQQRFNQAIKMAQTLAKSSIVPMHFRGKPEDIFACVMLGEELGFKPMMSLNSIVMIQGNATLKAQTMMAIVKAKCLSAHITISCDEESKSVTVFARRDLSDPGYTATWNLDKAKAMGLLNKDNWIKQPMTMLRWRACSEALRMVFADLLMGIYSTEEMQDITTVQTSQISNETFK